jgi:hypothetical protein
MIKSAGVRRVRSTLEARGPEVRAWLGVVELGCALILVGALLMLFV